jgi:hypothetical protein
LSDNNLFIQFGFISVLAIDYHVLNKHFLAATVLMGFSFQSGMLPGKKPNHFKRIFAAF